MILNVLRSLFCHHLLRRVCLELSDRVEELDNAFRRNAHQLSLPALLRLLREASTLQPLAFSVGSLDALGLLGLALFLNITLWLLIFGENGRLGWLSRLGRWHRLFIFGKTLLSLENLVECHLERRGLRFCPLARRLVVVRIRAGLIILFCAFLM